MRLNAKNMYDILYDVKKKKGRASTDCRRFYYAWITVLRNGRGKENISFGLTDTLIRSGRDTASMMRLQ